MTNSAWAESKKNLIIFNYAKHYTVSMYWVLRPWYHKGADIEEDIVLIKAKFFFYLKGPKFIWMVNNTECPSHDSKGVTVYENQNYKIFGTLFNKWKILAIFSPFLSQEEHRYFQKHRNSECSWGWNYILL